MYEVVTPQQTFSQPEFKHWYKLCTITEEETEIFDLYFSSDSKRAVVINGKVVIVDPTKKEFIKDDSFEIYHVISK